MIGIASSVSTCMNEVVPAHHLVWTYHLRPAGLEKMPQLWLRPALPQLLSLLNASFEEGYHKGFNSFDKELTRSLQDSPKKTTTPSSKKN
jgi:hypothetical protein